MKKTYEEMLKDDGILCTTHVGFSMMPLLREKKDVIVISPPQREYRSMDIVLFRRIEADGRCSYVLHRILKLLPGDSCWIAGDNCITGDFVKKDAILGVLSGLRRENEDFDFSSFGYRMYLLFWVRPYHMRFFLLRLKGFLMRLGAAAVRRVRKVAR